VLHVIEAQPVVTDWLPIGGMGEVAIQIEQKANAAMESLVQSAKKSLTGLAVTTEVTSGRAFVEIVLVDRSYSAYKPYTSVLFPNPTNAVGGSFILSL
jgi:hypothetical protein